jgi:hypothetical protein
LFLLLGTPRFELGTLAPHANGHDLASVPKDQSAKDNAQRDLHD